MTIVDALVIALALVAMGWATHQSLQASREIRRLLLERRELQYSQMQAWVRYEAERARCADVVKRMRTRVTEANREASRLRNELDDMAVIVAEYRKQLESAARANPVGICG